MAVEENNNNAEEEEHNDDAGAGAPMAVDNNDALEEGENDPITPLAAAAAAAAAAPVVNLNLEAIRQRFRNPQAILRASRGETTFCNHQRENTKLILYIYENNHELLNDHFYHELRQADGMIDYDHITHPLVPIGDTWQRSKGL